MLTARSGLSHVASKVTVTQPPYRYVQEKELISTFTSTGCGCTKRCSCQFAVEHVTSVRASCAEVLMASLNTSSTVSIVGRHKEDECKKAYTSFFHQGKPVCARMFRFHHGVENKRLKNLTRSFKENGLAPQFHSNT